MLTGTPVKQQLGLKTATTVYVGGLICIDSTTGYAVPGSVATTLRAVGRLSEDQPDFLPGQTITNAGASGTKQINVDVGTFKYVNSGANAITQAMVGGPCYVEDDETVSSDATGTSMAGKVIKLDDSTSPTGAGVWVEVGANPAPLGE